MNAADTEGVQEGGWLVGWLVLHHVLLGYFKRESV